MAAPARDPGARDDLAGAASLLRADDCFVGRFTAMASPCEVIVDTDDRAAAAAMVGAAAREAERIERKFSRYRADNIIHRINHAGGQPITVDDETAGLIDYAVTCWEMSGGMFDITSGALRRVWTFDGGRRVPDDAAVSRALEHVGWHKVTWRPPALTLPRDMEIDFGGIGKEYAVDRAAAAIAVAGQGACLVNFGGDLFAGGARRGGRPWAVGVDDPGRTGEAALYKLEFERGGLATSGDARRFVMWNGQRLGPILDPRAGWPVRDAPRSVTVLAGTCVEAGTLSTLACLRGAGARAFLEEQGVRFWIC